MLFISGLMIPPNRHSTVQDNISWSQVARLALSVTKINSEIPYGTKKLMFCGMICLMPRQYNLPIKPWGPWTEKNSLNNFCKLKIHVPLANSGKQWVWELLWTIKRNKEQKTKVVSPVSTIPKLFLVLSHPQDRKYKEVFSNLVSISMG